MGKDPKNPPLLIQLKDKYIKQRHGVMPAFYNYTASNVPCGVFLTTKNNLELWLQEAASVWKDMQPLFTVLNMFYVLVFKLRMLYQEMTK